MITLNPIFSGNGITKLENSKTVNFCANKVEYPKDKFVSSQKNKKVFLSDEIAKIITGPKAIKILHNDIQIAQKYKQKIKTNEEGAKTITLYKGLGILPYSYKGEIYYDKGGNINYVILLGNKEKFYKTAAKKSIIINKSQGIHTIFENSNNSKTINESYHDLAGVINKRIFYAKDKTITLNYKKGKLQTKNIDFHVASGITNIQYIYDKNSTVKQIIKYTPDKNGGTRIQAFNEDGELVFHKLSGLKLKNKIVNILEIFKNGKRTKLKEVTDVNGHDYSLRKGNLEIKFHSPNDIFNSDDKKISVEIYNKGEYRGTRNINIKKIINSLL